MQPFIVIYLVCQPHPWENQWICSNNIVFWVMKDNCVTSLRINCKSEAVLDHVCLQGLRVLEGVAHPHEHITRGLGPVGAGHHVPLLLHVKEGLANSFVESEGVILKAGPEL